jgi:hypothetical protein
MMKDELVAAEFRRGRDVGMPKGGRVRSAHECAQLFVRYSELVRSDVKGEIGHGKIDKGVGFSVVLPVGW